MEKSPWGRNPLEKTSQKIGSELRFNFHGYLNITGMVFSELICRMGGFIQGFIQGRGLILRSTVVSPPFSWHSSQKRTIGIIKT